MEPSDDLEYGSTRFSERGNANRLAAQALQSPAERVVPSKLASTPVGHTRRSPSEKKGVRVISPDHAQ